MSASDGEREKITYERLGALAEALELSDSVTGVETLLEAVRELVTGVDPAVFRGARRWVRSRDREVDASVRE